MRFMDPQAMVRIYQILCGDVERLIHWRRRRYSETGATTQTGFVPLWPTERSPPASRPRLTGRHPNPSRHHALPPPAQDREHVRQTQGLAPHRTAYRGFGWRPVVCSELMRRGTILEIF